MSVALTRDEAEKVAVAQYGRVVTSPADHFLVVYTRAGFLQSEIVSAVPQDKRVIAWCSCGLYEEPIDIVAALLEEAD